MPDFLEGSLSPVLPCSSGNITSHRHHIIAIGPVFSVSWSEYTWPGGRKGPSIGAIGLEAKQEGAAI